MSPSSPLVAQDASDPPPLSPSCRAPISDIAAPAPLPHLAAALNSQRTVRVMAIGSSSTVGVGASSPAKTYPAQLEAILERTFTNLDVVVTNRGVSGELAATTAERLKSVLLVDQPDVVLWQVGTNDALAKVPADEFKAMVQNTVRWLKEHRVDTVLVGLQYSPRVAQDAHHTAIRQALREIASAENVLLVRRFEAMQFVEKTKEGNLLSRDGLHQNDLGYRCMAEHIARAVVVSAFSFNRVSGTSPWAVQTWIAAVGAKTAYIERGSPWENGYVESFNARLRDELLDGEIFYTLQEAKVVIESWRRHDNSVRPHASLGYRPPAPEVFVPALAAWPAAPSRPAAPARHPVAPRPTMN